MMAHDIPESGPGVEHHWGYYNRQLPCTSDAGKCAYLDTVYHSHDLSILYSAILWAVVLGIVILCFIAHYCNPISRRSTPCVQKEDVRKHNSQSGLYRLRRSLSALYHRYLLQESLHPIFGRTTRFNVLVLAILAGYLIIFSFVGIVYQTWYSPVPGTSLRSTRVGLGPWADRIGVLAYALTPLAVLLCTRESLLSLCTGIPYHHFNFLHRWLGYIIYVQSALHTLGWTIVEGKLYQPQPETWNPFVAQEYIIWGIVAMIFLSFLVFFSTTWAIRLTGYEFFRKTHYVVAMLYVGACWGHWAQLSCWMIASLVVWLLDRGTRLLRMFLTHFGPQPDTSSWGLHIPKARLTCFPNAEDGDVVRLDFDHAHSPWEIGQHFYLCFPSLSIWQSHPMTPCSVPGGSTQSHTYIIRAKQGITKDLARQAPTPTPIVLSGPYGQPTVDNDLHCTDDINLFCLAAGTGITFILPLLQAIVLTRFFPSRRSLVELVWIIRRTSDMQWLAPELHALRSAAQSCPHFHIHIYITREGPANIDPFIPDSEPQFTIHPSPPNIPSHLTDFIHRTPPNPTRVLASGPQSLISSLRTTIASLNDPTQVWRGNERRDVSLFHDER